MWGAPQEASLPRAVFKELLRFCQHSFSRVPPAPGNKPILYSYLIILCTSQAEKWFLCHLIHLSYLFLISSVAFKFVPWPLEARKNSKVNQYDGQPLISRSIWDHSDVICYREGKRDQFPYPTVFESTGQSYLHFMTCNRLDREGECRSF